MLREQNNIVQKDSQKILKLEQNGQIDIKFYVYKDQ